MDLRKQDPYATARIIKDGDLVIVYVSLQNMIPMKVKSGGSFQNKFGVFKYDDFIGLPFGSKASGYTGV